MMGIEDKWAAFCVDEAVSVFGAFIENKLSERTNVGMPRHSLDNLLKGELGRSRKATLKALREM